MRTLSALDVARYSAARRTGGIRYGDGAKTKPVRQRTVHADLVLLRGMLRLACTIPAVDTRPDGPRWLDRKPLDGMRSEREKNPVRSVASCERFVKTRATLQRLAANAESDAERGKWTRLELALVLAEATGRRRGAIVALSWEGIDFDAATIRWRAEYDKKGVESVVPVPPVLLQELTCFRKRLGVIAGRLFPSKKRPCEPMPAELLTQWLTAAQEKAKIPKLPQGLWHPYRRKWASERMHLPLEAVADAGGWKDTATLLAVMSEPRKRREARPGHAPARLPAAAELQLDLVGR